nr:PREDICTED: uncharacterized protein LOC102366250 [Latimeria chalumnae]|eukprot:XP_006012602.1 PREDICTED: uncharacterized protein LOC102366250 [Latimeria chalumnae]
MTPEDDVEAYLLAFERYAEQENWPREQWAGIVAPFLMGESQKTYFDLEPEAAADYFLLKVEILARAGVTPTVRAQRFHTWAYQADKAPRSQMFDLIHLTQRWLQPDRNSPAKIAELVVMDCYLRALPLELRKWVGQGNPTDAQELIALVERQVAAEELVKTTTTTKIQRTPGHPLGPKKDLSSGKTILGKGGTEERVTSINGEELEQLLIPQTHKQPVLELAHKHLFGGHLGIEKILDRILRCFYWPGIYEEVRRYCTSCPECQLTGPQPHFKAPLIPLPIIDIPFKRIAMDLVGPLEKSSRGHEYILVILDYATQYPEAIPLRNMTSKIIANELVKVFSRVGIPKEILTNQGTPFMSRLMKELCDLLHIKTLRTSVYHPQTDGLVERFNRTLKSMLKKVVSKDGKNWDTMLPYLMFAIRDVPQSSTGFSPFELLYGRQPRGILDVAKETWEEQTGGNKNIIEHVVKMRERIEAVTPIVKAHIGKTQTAQKASYNRQAVVRKFQPGDRVMILLSTPGSKLFAKWQGPFEVIEAVDPVNYKIKQPGRRRTEQIYHINLLKPWKENETMAVLEGPLGQPDPVEEGSVHISEDLTPDQKKLAVEMVERNQDVFSSSPGRTRGIYHDIITPPGVTVKVKPYRIPEAKRREVATEVQRMLELGVIEESFSQWSSPIVLVPKPNGTWRFCNDFQKLNEVSKFDAYPMPRVDELIERLGKANYLTTLDLTKGYWQIPLTRSAIEKTAFITLQGLFQYTVMPFGLHGAPAMFQRLMDRVLRPHTQYASAYLDDVIIHSVDWESHLQKVEAVVDSLRKTGLMANPEKCYVGLSEARYLGYIVGGGLVRPQINKVEAIKGWPQPVNKRQVPAAST